MTGEMNRSIIKGINEQKTLQQISSDLQIGEHTLQAIIDSLLRDQYLTKITYTKGCASCPLGCNSGHCSPEFTMLSLTSKGKGAL